MNNKNLNFEQFPQRPHGGTLVNRMVQDDERESAVKLADTLPSIRIDLEAVITIEMIATGVLSPNTGFMKEADYLSVLELGRLSDGTVWPVPLSFAPTGDRNSEVIKKLKVGDRVSLTDSQNTPVAILDIEDIFSYDREHRAQKLFGTTDRAHPGVDSIYRRMGDVSLGGTLTMLQRADWGPFEKLRQEPKDTWDLFYNQRKFRSVAGFITGANPLHRGHEYIHKHALEEVDGLLLQPLVEMAKREYVRHEYRMAAYRNVLETYYPSERTLLSPLRVTYIFAGPRETVLHALIMKNYGCTHALVGRDHAGIGSYYDKYASHSVFDDFTPEELGIKVQLFHEVFYCTRCACHATTETCPHDLRYRLNISGTGIREMLRHGILPPKEVVRPESALVAIQGVQPKGLDENGNGTMPVGKVVASMFPYYLTHSRLGGPLRRTPLEPAQLTTSDLEHAILDARANANVLYQQIYSEYCTAADHNQMVGNGAREEAYETIRRHQGLILEDLQQKAESAPDQASDEFMYQDKTEVGQELAAAVSMLEHVAGFPSPEERQSRIWNPLPYERYRSS